MSNTVTYRSADGRREAVLEFAGEVRFGPFWFTLRVDELDMCGRFFGDAVLWSPDSRYLAIQEWLTTDEAEGPHTALLVIDFAKRRECRISEAKGGFIHPTSFEGDVIVYFKRYLGTGIIREKEMDLAKLQRWEALREAS